MLISFVLDAISLHMADSPQSPRLTDFDGFLLHVLGLGNIMSHKRAVKAAIKLIPCLQT